MSRLQERRHWAKLVEMELATIYQDPIAPLIHPLVFHKDPKDGLAIGNPGMDWRKPNEGDLALKEKSHSNVPFLHLEYRLSHLMSTAMSMRPSRERTSVVALLEAAHYRMNNEKTLHWRVQHAQRGATSDRENVVHTGKCHFCIAQAKYEVNNAQMYISNQRVLRNLRPGQHIFYRPPYTHCISGHDEHSKYISPA